VFPDQRRTSPEFDERVYALVRQVPEGRVVTYGAIARALGEPRKAREVGWAMHHCPDDVPAHRVINRFGEVTGDLATSGAEFRRRELEAEGVRFDQRGRCDLGRYGWEPPARLADPAGE
jgi:methylated-DNA-protein-cysteine methyltransferase related protein